jgi:hypothetical protein
VVEQIGEQVSEELDQVVQSVGQGIDQVGQAVGKAVDQVGDIVWNAEQTIYGEEPVATGFPDVPDDVGPDAGLNPDGTPAPPPGNPDDSPPDEEGSGSGGGGGSSSDEGPADYPFPIDLTID